MTLERRTVRFACALAGVLATVCHVAQAADAATAEPQLADPPSSQPAELPGRDARLGRLPGRPVKNAQGTVLGQVTGVLADLHQRRIAALLVDAGGHGFTCRLGRDALAIGREHVYASRPATSLADVGGCSAGFKSPGGDLVRGRDLLQAHFRDPRGKDVGTLAEVVVKAEDGTFHYYVGDFGSAWVQDGKLVGLPLRPIELIDGRLVLEAGLMELMQTPVFDAKRLDDVWSPAFAAGMERYVGASR